MLSQYRTSPQQPIVCFWTARGRCSAVWGTWASTTCSRKTWWVWKVGGANTTILERKCLLDIRYPACAIGYQQRHWCALMPMSRLKYCVTCAGFVRTAMFLVSSTICQWTRRDHRFSPLLFAMPLFVGVVLQCMEISPFNYVKMLIRYQGFPQDFQTAAKY